MTLYTNRYTIGGFKNSAYDGKLLYNYWSSSRSDDNNQGYYVNFTNGHLSERAISYSVSARRVRSLK